MATVLTWAATGDPSTSANSWSSSSPDYEVNVFPDWFTPASHYVSIRFQSVGTSDWRINAFQPVSTIIPSTNVRNA